MQSRLVQVPIHSVLRIVHFAGKHLSQELRDTLWLGVEAMLLEGAEDDRQFGDEDIELFIDHMCETLKNYDIYSDDQLVECRREMYRNFALFKAGFPYQTSFLQVLDGGKKDAE